MVKKPVAIQVMKATVYICLKLFLYDAVSINCPIISDLANVPLNKLCETLTRAEGNFQNDLLYLNAPILSS